MSTNSEEREYAASKKNWTQKQKEADREHQGGYREGHFERQRKRVARMAAQRAQEAREQETMAQNNREAAAATAAVEASKQSMLALQEESRQLAANSQADLSGDNASANVVAGGSADSSGSAEEDLVRRSRARGISSQLGINI